MTGANLSEDVVSTKRQALNAPALPPTRKERKYDPRVEPFSKPAFEAELEELAEEEKYTQYQGVFKGFLWALLLSIHLWLIVGIVLAWIF